MLVMLACHFSLSGRSVSLFVAGQCWRVTFRDRGQNLIHLIRGTSLFLSAKVSPEALSFTPILYRICFSMLTQMCSLSGFSSWLC